MKRSNRLILLIGVFFAILAFIGVILLGQQNGTATGPAAEPTTGPTVFASRDIPLGVAITMEMLTQDDAWPLAKREATAFADVTLVVGKIARRDIVAGKQLTAEDFSSSRSTGLTEVTVPPGLRAIAVQVDQVSGVGTIINTGDYVDLIVTLSGETFPVVQIDPATDGITVVEGLNATSVKLILQGMQVVGTLLPPPPVDANGRPVDTSTTTLNGQQELVILAVTAQQAEVIRFAQSGSITLLLRSPKDFVDADGVTRIVPPAEVTTGLTLRTLIDGYGVLTPELIQAIMPSPAP